MLAEFIKSIIFKSKKKIEDKRKANIQFQVIFLYFLKQKFTTLIIPKMPKTSPIPNKIQYPILLKGLENNSKIKV